MNEYNIKYVELIEILNILKFVEYGFSKSDYMYIIGVRHFKIIIRLNNLYFCEKVDVIWSSIPIVEYIRNNDIAGITEFIKYIHNHSLFGIKLRKHKIDKLLNE